MNVKKTKSSKKIVLKIAMSMTNDYFECIFTGLWIIKVIFCQYFTIFDKGDIQY